MHDYMDPGNSAMSPE